MSVDSAIAVTGDLSGLKDIIIPDSVGFWPPAPAWYALILLALFFLFRKGYQWLRQYHADRYRRQAQHRLETLEKIIMAAQETEPRLKAAMALPALLKQTAISAYQRQTVAGLSQEKWLAFLDAHCSQTNFSGKSGHLLQLCSYGTPDRISTVPRKDFAELIAMTRKWVQKHDKGQE